MRVDEGEVFQKMTSIVADPALPKGTLYKTIERATDLSRDQIRHRRTKPAYKEILAIELSKYKATTTGSTTIQDDVDDPPPPQRDVASATSLEAPQPTFKLTPHVESTAINATLRRVSPHLATTQPTPAMTSNENVNPAPPPPAESNSVDESEGEEQPPATLADRIIIHGNFLINPPNNPIDNGEITEHLAQLAEGIPNNYTDQEAKGELGSIISGNSINISTTMSEWITKYIPTVQQQW